MHIVPTVPVLQADRAVEAHPMVMGCGEADMGFAISLSSSFLRVAGSLGMRGVRTRTGMLRPRVRGSIRPEPWERGGQLQDFDQLVLNEKGRRHRARKVIDP